MDTTPSTQPIRERATWAQKVIIALAMAVIMATIAGLLSPELDIRPFAIKGFNIYALPSLIVIITSCVTLWAVSRIHNKSDDLIWFGTQCAGMILLGVAELFTRIGADAHTAVFWWPISSAATYFSSAAVFMFVLSYVHPKEGRQLGTLVAVFGTTLLVTVIDARTLVFNQYLDSALVPAPWGGIVKPGPLYGLLTIWVLGLYGLCLAMLIRFWRTTLEPRLKRQARLFAVAMSIPMTVGTFTDGVLPVFGVLNILPLAVLMAAAMNVLFIYGIWRYRVFELTPALVAASILDTMNEAVIGIGPDLAVRYVNKGAERMLGYTYQQFKDRRFSDFLTQNWDTDTLRTMLLTPLHRHGSNEFDSVDLQTADGGVVAAKLSVSRVDETDELQGYLVVITDITKIAQATEIIEREVKERTQEVQEAKATLVTSINSLELGFVITNSNLEVMRVNTVAHSLFCAHANMHPAGDCHEISLADVQKLLGSDMELSESIHSALRRQLPTRLRHVSFDNRDWHVSLSPMVVGKRSIGCVILFQDTTEEYLLERSRDEFFSIASHELRTPLTSIKGNSSMILDYYKQAIKDEGLRGMLGDIHESSERLIEIVDDFLDVSRLEQGRANYRMQELNLGELVHEVAADMTTLFKDKGLALELGPELTGKDKDKKTLPDVIADKNRLKQVLFNLLGNAVKYTERGGVTIRARVDHSQIKVEVRDTGAGIGPKQRPLLFHKFQQAGDSILTRDTTRGTGLGLYISRLLAQGMGGNLALAESEPGKGSVFVVTLLVSTPSRLHRLANTTHVVDTESGLLLEQSA